MTTDRFGTLSVLVPVYNESRTLETIAERILASPVDLEFEVVMVDDGSSDGSWEIMEQLAAVDRRIRIFRHPHNRGKGAAIRTAIDAMTGDIAIVQDADLEYDPAEFGRVLGPILSGHADAVFGSRFASSPVRRVLFYWHSLGNKLLTWLFNVFNDLNLTDMETCYKAVRSDVLKELRLESDRFGIEPEISTRLAQWGARIYEVPISYHGRTYAEGKHIGWRDGVQALWLILKFRFFDTEYSRTGEGSQVSLSDARAYAKWAVSELCPDLDRSVLEVDAGVGNYTRFLLKARELTVIERNPRLADALRRQYARSPHVSVVDATVGQHQDRQLGATFDLVVSFNTFAMAVDPELWLANVRALVDPAGSLRLLVPAHRSLTNAIDRSMHRRRRFDRPELEAMLDGAGFEVMRISEFNRLGSVAWRLNGLARLTAIGRPQARIYSLLVPVAKRFDRLNRGRGLSFVVEARRR